MIAIGRRMEDEGFVDDDFIEQAARDWAARDGVNCLPLLREQARIAEAAGDYLLAQTWRAILETAAALLGLDRG